VAAKKLVLGLTNSDQPQNQAIALLTYGCFGVNLLFELLLQIWDYSNQGWCIS
jgi:hypothetical protein